MKWDMPRAGGFGRTFGRGKERIDYLSGEEQVGEGMGFAGGPWLDCGRSKLEGWG